MEAHMVTGQSKLLPVQPVHGDGGILLIILLIFEGDGDAVGQVEVGVAVVEFALVIE
jgi:hypothetical protein